ncbi:MAG: hypothetical protein ACOYN0_01830 [Phycisphaerales bacterium]
MTRSIRVFGACVLAALASARAAAQDKDPVQKPAEPTLDELLSLPGTGVGTPGDRGREELDKKLGESSVDDDFVRATDLMKRSADRLTGDKDAGLDTQRMQEDTLKLLDKMLDEAQKRRRKQQKQQQQQQQQQQQSQQSQQQQAQSQQQQQQQGKDKQGSEAQSNPDGGGNNSKGTDGDLNALTGKEGSWGNLPPHVRDALRQGLGDRFSSMYRAMTEQYYRRLAKDPSASPKQE